MQFSRYPCNHQMLLFDEDLTASFILDLYFEENSANGLVCSVSSQRYQIMLLNFVQFQQNGYLQFTVFMHDGAHSYIESYEDFTVDN